MIISLCQKNMKDWNKCCIRPAVDMQAFPLAKVSVSGEGERGGEGVRILSNMHHTDLGI